MTLAFITAEEIVRGLLHSVWQSALVLAALYIILAALKDSGKRYAASLIALALVCMLSVANIAYFHSLPPAQNVAGAADTPDFSPPAPAAEANTAHAAQTPLHKLKSINFYELGAGLWLAGASCLLLRLLIMLIRGASLAGSATAITDSSILNALEELRIKLKITGRVVLLASERIGTPLVAGVIRPVILMPVCMLSEHSLEQVTAALAHELVHIRRFDPFINILQIMAESILFFNPAVWIISRQVRLEREAVCDSLAITYTGNAAGYAELLLDFLSRVCPQNARAAVAFADGEKPSVDRLRRIIQPGYKPVMRFGVLPFLAAAVICAIFAGLTWSGSEKAFSYIGEKLSSEEKIAKIAQLNEELGSEASIDFSGFVVNENDEPVTEFNMDVRTANHSIGLGGGGCGGEAVNTFRTTLSQKGLCEVAVSAEGYADFYDKFNIRDNDAIAGYKIVLSKGFKASIMLTSDSGEPVANAEIKLRVKGEEYSIGNYHTCTTDSAGIAVLEHAPAHPLLATMTAGGFEELETELLFTEQNSAKTVTLTKTKPCELHIVNADGEAVAGAKLWITCIDKFGHQHQFGLYGDGDAASDENGVAVLSSLVKGYIYTIAAKADGCGYGGTVAKAGEQVEIKLPPATIIEGVIKGKDLKTRLMRNYWKDGQRYDNPAIYVNSHFNYLTTQRGPFRGTSNIYEWYEVEIVDGAGFFTIDGAFGDEADFRVENKKVGEIKFDFAKGGKFEVFIDLDELDSVQKQKVVIRFKQPEGMPAPEGSVMLANDVTQDHNSVDVVDGKIEAEVNVPAKLRVYTNNQNRLTGYSFDQNFSEKFDVTEYSEEPQEFSYVAIPAGCIVGRLMDAAGAKIAGKVSVCSYDRQYKRYNTADNATSWDAGESGEYVASPLETGREYIVTAMMGNYLAVSELIEITEKKMIAQCDLTIGKTADITGQILNADGSPASGIAVSGNLQGYGRYDNFKETRADSDGHFSIACVNPDSDIRCHVKVSRDGERFTVTGKAGDFGALKMPETRQKTITVVDKLSEEPIKGVKVRSNSQITGRGVFTNHSMDGNTGNDGKCTVNILADANDDNGWSIQIDASGMNPYSQSTSGRKDVFELQPLFGLKGKFVDADTGEPLANLKFKFHGKYDSGTTYNSYRFDSFTGADGSFDLGLFHPENIILDETPGFAAEPAYIEFHFGKDNITRDVEIKVRPL